MGTFASGILFYYKSSVLSNLNHSIRIRNDQVMAKTKT